MVLPPVEDPLQDPGPGVRGAQDRGRLGEERIHGQVAADEVGRDPRRPRDAREVAMRVRHAGAIFVGTWSPVSLGDYSAGSTHVLPTAGAGAHSSGLTVRSFVRTVHVINYDEAALMQIADGVERFALAEDLPGHAAAVTVRRRS